MKTIIVDGKEYVEKETTCDKEYVLCRTYSAGVFAGYLGEREGKEVTLLNARRIWRWDGAASLSELAMKGTSKPSECRFPCEVDEVLLTEVIEIIPITPEAKKTIDSVPVWTAHE
jgi:hypothetical protein